MNTTIFKSSGYKVKYVISTTDITEIVSFLDFSYNITSITPSSTISGYEISINGGAYSTPSLPLTINANDYLVFRIAFNGGENKGALIINGTKN